MNKTDRYARDLKRNKYVSLFRKKRWVLFFLRKEQDAPNRFVRKFYALGKKIALSGTCCELPAESFAGGGLVIAHLNGIVVAPQNKVGEDCVFYQQVTLGINGRKSLEMGLGANGREMATKKFDLECNVRKLDHLYRSIVTE